MNASELVKVLKEYLDDSESQLESDGSLPALDVTHTAAGQLFNDLVLYAVHAPLVENDLSVAEFNDLSSGHLFE